MTAFDEAKHLRESTGRFAAKVGTEQVGALTEKESAPHAVVRSRPRKGNFDLTTAKPFRSGDSREAYGHLTQFDEDEFVVVTSELGKTATCRITGAGRPDGHFGSWESFRVKANVRPGGYTYDVTNAALTRGRLNIRHASDEEAEAWRSEHDLSPAARVRQLSLTLVNEGKTAFKVEHGDATYHLEEVDHDVANHVGCPDATHRLIGAHEIRYGRIEHCAVVRVAVPGWPDRKGARAVFVSDEDPNFEPLQGFVGE